MPASFCRSDERESVVTTEQTYDGIIVNRAMKQISSQLPDYKLKQFAFVLDLHVIDISVQPNLVESKRNRT